MIDKETFIQFLRDNNFYDAWMEGYDLDNELYDDEVPLDEFLSHCNTNVWLYYGISALAWELKEDGNIPEDLLKRFKEWRSKHLADYIDLDQKWMDFVALKSRDTLPS